ncbi:uncharacterized protein [Triticum aestivum]|uniref:uncharacterized protein n=1 Tax=Triticum aestivum TaxID=4565 RepID=UPI001D01FFE0|nr:uncharacterized protein LOC123090201 [Triticum aestivum]
MDAPFLPEHPGGRSASNGGLCRPGTSPEHAASSVLEPASGGRREGARRGEREIRWAPLAVRRALTPLPAWISGGSHLPAGPASQPHNRQPRVDLAPSETERFPAIRSVASPHFFPVPYSSPVCRSCRI